MSFDSHRLKIGDLLKADPGFGTAEHLVLEILEREQDSVSISVWSFHTQTKGAYRFYCYGWSILQSI